MIEVRNNPIEMKNDTVFCNVQRAVFFIRNVKIISLSKIIFFTLHLGRREIR